MGVLLSGEMDGEYFRRQSAVPHFSDELGPPLHKGGILPRFERRQVRSFGISEFLHTSLLTVDQSNRTKAPIMTRSID